MLPLENSSNIFTSGQWQFGRLSSNACTDTVAHIINAAVPRRNLFILRAGSIDQDDQIDSQGSVDQKAQKELEDQKAQKELEDQKNQKELEDQKEQKGQKPRKKKSKGYLKALAEKTEVGFIMPDANNVKKFSHFKIGQRVGSLIVNFYSPNQISKVTITRSKLFDVIRTIEKKISEASDDKTMSIDIETRLDSDSPTTRVRRFIKYSEGKPLCLFQVSVFMNPQTEQVEESYYGIAMSLKKFMAVADVLEEREAPLEDGVNIADSRLEDSYNNFDFNALKLED